MIEPRHQAILAALLLLAGCGRGGREPPAEPAPAPADASAVPAPPPALDGVYLGRWASDERACPDQAWVVTATSLDTPGHVSCRFDSIAERPAGPEIAATCTAEGPPQPATLRLSYDQSARALLIEGGPFADVGLVRCPAPSSQ
jgi:hypothetical protein